MAQAAITKITDGNRSATFHVFIEGDGSGELSDLVIIDPETSFDESIEGVPTLTIERLWHVFSGFSAKLEFDYLTGDTPAWVMPDGSAGSKFDFYKFEGIKDRSAVDGQGKIKITTVGLGLGDFGSFMIRVRKD